LINRLLVFILTAVLVSCFFCGAFSRTVFQAVSDNSKRVHVYCECRNSWVNGRVENSAHVELRDGTSFGLFYNKRHSDHPAERVKTQSRSQVWWPEQYTWDIPEEIFTKNSQAYQCWIIPPSRHGFRGEYSDYFTRKIGIKIGTWLSWHQLKS
jgi:hypothetical protein